MEFDTWESSKLDKLLVTQHIHMDMEKNQYTNIVEIKYYNYDKITHVNTTNGER